MWVACSVSFDTISLCRVRTSIPYHSSRSSVRGRLINFDGAPDYAGLSGRLPHSSG